jgi:hypothetical protein
MAGFTFVASATSTTGSIVVPAAAQAGDFAVLIDCGMKDGGVPGDFSITGWTATALNFTFNSTGSFVDQRTKCFYRVLIATDPGTSVAGQDLTTDAKVMLVFRPTHVVSAVTPAANVNSASDTNPASVSIVMAGQTPPVIGVAFWKSSGTVSPRTMSPAMDAEVQIATSSYCQYIIYNTGETPANHTADIDDEGNSNAVSGLRFTFTFGAEIVRGTLSASEARDIISADAEVEDVVNSNATVSATEARDTISAEADADVSGTVSATEARDTISAEADAEASGVLSATEARDTIASTAEAPGQATLAATEARDTITADATAGNVASATLSATEARDTIASTTTADVSANLSATEARDAIASTAQAPGQATLSAIEARDAIASTATVAASATLSATEVRDAIASTATADVSANLAATEARDLVQAQAPSASLANVAATEARDLIAAAGSSVAQGTVSSTEARDTIASTAQGVSGGTLSRTEARDTIASAASVEISGTVSATEARDAIASTATADVAASVDVTEARDTVSSNATVGLVMGIVGNATEAGDVLASSSYVSDASPLSRFRSAWPELGVPYPLIPVANLEIALQQHPGEFIGLLIQAGGTEDIVLGSVPWVVETGTIAVAVIVESGTGFDLADFIARGIIEAYRGYVSDEEDFWINRTSGPTDAEPEANGERYILRVDLEYNWQYRQPVRAFGAAA